MSSIPLGTLVVYNGDIVGQSRGYDDRATWVGHVVSSEEAWDEQHLKSGLPRAIYVRRLHPLEHSGRYYIAYGDCLTVLNGPVETEDALLKFCREILEDSQ